MSSVLRSIPSVTELLDSPPLKSLVNRVSRNVVVSGVRQFLEDMRSQVQTAAAGVHVPTASELAQRIADWIATEELPSLRPVINATGILLHTGLGRAPLAEEAIAAIGEVSRGYASVELDLASGERSQRAVAVERQLTRLTGAEAAAVVNNNAGATLLTLAALATGREVIVSRGQLIEIGGSYRLPEVMTASGTVLREVGTTNKTRIGDYAAAIGEKTAALLRVHTSNYAVVGFTEETPLAELVALGRKHDLPVIDDIGSGALVDLSPYGVKGEPIAGESIRAGADLVLFSGDKLLGGPQCGIVAGRRNLVQQILKHPLTRALRVDKLTLAALAATLRLYEDPAHAERSVPLLTLLATPLENLRHRAERLAPQIQATGVAAVEVVTDRAYVGGGSLPNQSLATICLALTPATGTVDALAAALRRGTPAVVGRIQEGRLLLDLRSVQPRDDTHLVAAVEALRKVKNELPAELTPVG
ncbi:MAG TPA: L-seryl-tRNA(Sec) selenium transferase [Pirellulaceae bacterium]|nr:L-seryl-tRNA(Sec) selenium transferase [Pirellulaceae bacterium]